MVNVNEIGFYSLVVIVFLEYVGYFIYIIVGIGIIGILIYK